MIAAKGIGRVDDLIEKASADPALPIAAKAAVQVLARQLAEIGKSIAGLAAGIMAAHKQNPVSRLARGHSGGRRNHRRGDRRKPCRTLASSNRAAAFPPGPDRRHGKTPAAASGGKEKLGAITKQGNCTIRRLLVLGAASLLGAARKKKGPLRDWHAAPLARRPARLASIAMASKLARVAWAMMAAGEAFRAEAFERA